MAQQFLPLNKVCEWCNKKYHPQRWFQRFCSPKCCGKHHSKERTEACQLIREMAKKNAAAADPAQIAELPTKAGMAVHGGREKDAAPRSDSPVNRKLPPVNSEHTVKAKLYERLGLNPIQPAPVPAGAIVETRRKR